MQNEISRQKKAPSAQPHQSRWGQEKREGTLWERYDHFFIHANKVPTAQKNKNNISSPWFFPELHYVRNASDVTARILVEREAYLTVCEVLSAAGSTESKWSAIVQVQLFL
jgi:hypothetical protein